MFLPSKRFGVRCHEHLNICDIGRSAALCLPSLFPSTVWSTFRELLRSELLHLPVIIQSCAKLWVMRPFKFIDFFLHTTLSGRCLIVPDLSCGMSAGCKELFPASPEIDDMIPTEPWSESRSQHSGASLGSREVLSALRLCCNIHRWMFLNFNDAPFIT